MNEWKIRAVRNRPGKGRGNLQNAAVLLSGCKVVEVDGNRLRWVLLAQLAVIGAGIAAWWLEWL